MSFIKTIWDTWWLQWRWPLKLGSIIAIVLVLGLVIGFFKSCGRKTVKIDQESINKINSENRKEREAELQKVVEENSDVVNTVDNRTAIAETNTIERNRLIEEKVKAVDAKIAEAKQQGRNVTQEELECLLVPENCQ